MDSLPLLLLCNFTSLTFSYPRKSLVLLICPPLFLFFTHHHFVPAQKPSTSLSIYLTLHYLSCPCPWVIHGRSNKNYILLVVTCTLTTPFILISLLAVFNLCDMLNFLYLMLKACSAVHVLNPASVSLVHRCTKLFIYMRQYALNVRFQA